MTGERRPSTTVIGNSDLGTVTSGWISFLEFVAQKIADEISKEPGVVEASGLGATQVENEKTVAST